MDWKLLLAPLLALVGALIGSLVAPLVTDWRARRTRQGERQAELCLDAVAFSQTILAVAVAHAASPGQTPPRLERELEAQAQLPSRLQLHARPAVLEAVRSVMRAYGRIPSSRAAREGVSDPEVEALVDAVRAAVDEVIVHSRREVHGRWGRRLPPQR